MKQGHSQFAEFVRSGPSGLFSVGDLNRLELHINDGLAISAVIEELPHTTIVDIGSGGGVPGMQMALELTNANISLVESQTWKADFLRACARTLALESKVTVFDCRAEEVLADAAFSRCEVGTARAVAAPAVVAEWLAPLVVEGGHLVLPATEAQLALLPNRPLAELGLGAPWVVSAASELRETGRCIIWPREGKIEPRFPRRPGMAKKRPLS